MIEAFLSTHADILSNPIVFSIALFLLIVTQVFGFLFNVVLLFVSPFMDPVYFVLSILVAGLSAETINFFVGRHFAPFFKKRFPHVIKVMNSYTNFGTMLTGRFIGIPLLSHVLGLERNVPYRRFLLPTLIFFLVNGIVIFTLGNTIPLKYFGIIIICFILLVVWQSLHQKRKHR